MRSAGISALVSMLLLGVGCLPTGPSRVEVTADAAAGEVPFRLVGPNEAALVVEARVQGEGPFDFVLDTGATFTCVDSALAERLGLEDAAGVIGGGAGIGGAGRVRMVQIESLQIGETTAHDLMGCAIDLSRLSELPGIDVQGLLGLNFLREFRVTLDFQNRILRLEPPGGEAGG